MEKETLDCLGRDVYLCRSSNWIGARLTDRASFVRIGALAAAMVSDQRSQSTSSAKRVAA